ncbi:hypothetical protein V8B55DRAFT_1443303 [Mucor lusitanicus]|uniref:C2H2-type domain-containing protein n=1 Tax=Mucor circinelloides f. lusitanicus TaxID=29924 RepID=A0A8H4BRJ2_MUCCL|nr:hypothetical protein FB192DRAFT_1318031 [Mucor lusitanicus]
MNNSTRIHLPPIHDMLYTLNSESSRNYQDTDTSRISPPSNSPTLSLSAPYPQVPDSEQSKNKVRGHHHQSYYHSPPQSQHSSDYYQKKSPSPYHQRDGTEDTNNTAPISPPPIDWQRRSADNYRNQNGYTSCSNTDQLSATNAILGNHRPSAVGAAATEPLQHHKSYHHVQRISHSRSYSDQFMQQNMRRSSASEKILVHSTSPVDPPLPPPLSSSSSRSPSLTSRPFHRRTASDVSSSNNRQRGSMSNSGHYDQQSLNRRHAHHFPPPNKIISANRYKCNECFKTFSRPSSLRIHILSHTGEKPHVCPQPDCGRRFSVQSNMRRHLKVHYCNDPSSQQQQQQQQHQNLQAFSSR